ncbi:hypothetical protein GCM10010430_01920 [Kitasatospora cystarginea]|uniref:Secreted protein n=1 Tax=Kitasatospora cystarginea TaxID=58350 RepID=A0ABP5Q977_9ACTN
MHPSPRIVSTLAALTLTLGGTVIAAPAAHADLGDCTAYLQDQGVELTDSIRTACYYGLVGSHDMCVNAMTQAAVSDPVATEACRRAPVSS